MDQEDHPRETADPINVDHYPRHRNCYRILSQLSEGDRAIVFKAICIPLSTIVAIKVIDLDGSGNRIDTLRLEAKNNEIPHHPNILKPYCYFADEAQLWVVMPFVAVGSLQSLVSYSFPHGLPLKCLATVLHRVVTALACMYARCHLHGGVKAGNILMDFTGAVMLSDFRVSASDYENESLLYWVAPEANASELGFNRRSDIWSFGVTALELFYGQPPVSQSPPQSKYAILKRFHYSKHYEKEEACQGHKILPELFETMIGSCLELDPLKRPSAKELSNNQFFKKCKGPGYLAWNMLHGLPEVEQRFKDPKIQKSLYLNKNYDIRSSSGEEEDVNKRKIIGWVFNQEWFLLKPVFKPDKWFGASSGLTPDCKDFANPMSEVIRDDLGIDNEAAVQGLMNIRDVRFDEQLSNFDARFPTFVEACMADETSDGKMN